MKRDGGREMIYKVSYIFKSGSEDDEEAEVTVARFTEAETYGVASPTLSGEVYIDSIEGRFSLFVEASSPEGALYEAESEFVRFFALQKKNVRKYFGLEKEKLKHLDVGDTVGVINPGKQYSTYFGAFAILTEQAWNNLYYGPYTFGKDIRSYDLNTSVFKVLARAECEADGQDKKELYLIAEEKEAYRHKWGEGSSCTEKDEPLNVFVINRQGLERW